MSREQNKLQREIEEGLVELKRKEEWLKRAQALTPFFVVTERDFLMHGDECPEEWLMVGQEEEPESEEEIWPDGLEYEDEYDEPPWEDDEFEMEYFYDVVVSLVEMFGERHYPVSHVRKAKSYLKGEANGEGEKGRARSSAGNNLEV